jgi:hypothetical protein
VVLDRPVYDLTIFKLRCGWFRLKIYTQGERVLRVETMAHNVKKLPYGCSLQKFPAVVAQRQGILKRFMDTLGCMDQCFLSDATLARLPAPSQLGKTKVGGMDFNRPRIHWVVEAVLSLASFPGGFTASPLAQPVRTLGQQSESEYGASGYYGSDPNRNGKSIGERHEGPEQAVIQRQGRHGATETP